MPDRRMALPAAAAAAATAADRCAEVPRVGLATWGDARTARPGVERAGDVRAGLLSVRTESRAEEGVPRRTRALLIDERSTILWSASDSSSAATAEVVRSASHIRNEEDLKESTPYPLRFASR